MLQRSKSGGHEATLLAASSLARTSRATLYDLLFAIFYKYSDTGADLSKSPRAEELSHGAKFGVGKISASGISPTAAFHRFPRQGLRTNDRKSRKSPRDDARRQLHLEDASRGWRLVDEPEVARRRAERARFLFLRAPA